MDEKVLPKNDITIREITANSELLAFVGRDVFEVIYAERKAATYQDKLLDKLIFSNTKYFISAN